MYYEVDEKLSLMKVSGFLLIKPTFECVHEDVSRDI